MNDDVTLRDVMNREFVGVGESDPVAGAAELMHEEGASVAVVLRGSELVGAFAAADVLALVGGGETSTDARVGDVMSTPPPTLAVDDPLADAVAAMADRDVDHVAVTDDAGVAGTVEAGDVVAAAASLSGTPDPVAGQAADAEGYVENDTEFASQSVCEVCGGLTPQLANVNGQLVCVDCRGF